MALAFALISLRSAAPPLAAVRKGSSPTKCLVESFFLRRHHNYSAPAAEHTGWLLASGMASIPLS